MGCCDGEALPRDMVFEILSRSSLGTVQRCKKVSKSMKQMIYEPTFLPLHCQRTNTLFGYLFQGVSYVNYHGYTTAFISDDHSRGAAAAIRANLPSNDLKIIASSDEGLLLCRRQTNRFSTVQYYACKPATNQRQQLPEPIFIHERFDAAAIVVLESDPLRYIILLVAGYGTESNCEIFDSETWAWEKIECEIPYGCSTLAFDASVTVSQSVNWLMTNDYVLTFDISERSFRYFPLPETAPYWESKQLVEYEGGLGFAGTIQGTKRNRMELWTAEGERWSRRKTAADMRAVRGKKRGPVPVDFCSSDVVFARSRNEDGTGFYNLRDGSFRRVEVPWAFRNPGQIFRFRSDFEIVNLRGGGRDYV